MTMILSWVTVGTIAAVLAYLLLPDRTKGGVMTTFIIGICGALLSGALASSIFSEFFDPRESQVVASAALGALLLTLAHRIFFQANKEPSDYYVRRSHNPQTT